MKSWHIGAYVVFILAIVIAIVVSNSVINRKMV